MLRNIEHRIESLVTGVFGRAFRSHVQPVEIARKLVKEMDDHKTVSLSRIYVPNEYLLYLSPRDREQFVGYEDGLLLELGGFLAEHARREGYSVASPPRVLLHEDDDLSIGEFGIATRMAQPPARPEPRPGPAPSDGAPAPVEPPVAPPIVVTPPAPPATRVAPPPPPPPEPVKPPAPADPDSGTGVLGPAAPAETSAAPADPVPRAVLVVSGARHEVGPGPTTLGRSRECDVTVEDPSVSRRHAELQLEDGAWMLTDLGSTNGTFVGGKRVDRSALSGGDRITLGQSELRFELV